MFGKSKKITKEKKEVKKEEDKEEDIVDDPAHGLVDPLIEQPEINPGEKVRVVSDSQLINFKIDGVGEYIKELDATMRQFNESIKKALEE